MVSCFETSRKMKREFFATIDALMREGIDVRAQVKRPSKAWRMAAIYMTKSQLCTGREPTEMGRAPLQRRRRASAQSLSPYEPSSMSSRHMELTRSVDKATNKVSNSLAQMDIRHPAVVLPYSSTAVASPFLAHPWESLPIVHRRQRM